MTCPNCHIENQPTAERCDCGHSFTGAPRIGSDANLASIAASIRTIKNVIVAWAIISVIGALLWSVAYITVEHEIRRAVQLPSASEKK